MLNTILALESSCDDTSASIVRNGKILTNIISSQDIHTRFGGVVPEMASRAHQRDIMSVVNQAFAESGVAKNELDAIAFTAGPGLIGSLLVTTSFAKGLALALDIPLIGINHLQAHVMANFIDDPKPKFPFLCLLVSGGHTQLIVVKSHVDFEIIGQSIDDAAGEAFDKAAKIIDLPYPGGPNIDKRARQGKIDRFPFPTPRIPELNYSFSGLKTSFLYKVRDELKKDNQFLNEQNINDLCASYQHKIVSYLMQKLEKAAKQTGINEISIAGGVAANSLLRSELERYAEKNGWKFYIPDFSYCTDNAAMIAITAHYKLLNNDFDNQKIKAFAR